MTDHIASGDAATSVAQRLEAYRRLFDLSGKTALVLGAASGITSKRIPPHIESGYRPI